MSTNSLYTFTTPQSVSANNLTTLYNSGATAVVPTAPYGNANVEAFLAAGTDGGNTIGNIVAAGNVSAGNVLANSGVYAANYFYANGAPLNVQGNYSNANVAAYLPTYTGNLAGGNLAINQNAVVSGNITTGLNMIAGGNIQATGNIRTTGPAGNITGAQYVAAQYFLGDGGLLSNITAANVGTLTTLTVTGNIVGGNLNTAGNVTGNYILGNGSQLTGLPPGYSNAQVASYLSSGNLTSNIITTANVAGEYVIANTALWFGSDTPTEQITADNLTMNFITNGQTRLSLTSGGGTVQGNLTLSNTIGQGILSAHGALITGDVSASGNITGQYFLGNGAFLTGLPASYSNANVVSLLANFGSNVISTTGNITAGNVSTTGNVTIAGSLNSDDITSLGVTVYGDQVITGNLTVQGTTTTINSNTISTNDKNITVANNQSTAANVDGAGIDAGNPAVATWRYNAATNSWQSNVGVTPVGNLTQELGNNQNRWSTVYTGAVDASGNVSAVGNVQGGNVIGAVWTNSITGSVAAGNIDIAPDGAGHVNLNADTVRIGDNNVNAVLASRGTGNLTIKPHEGDANQSLINIVEGLNGNIELTNNGTGNVNTARISASGNITAAYYIGNGSQLTGIVSTYGNANVSNFLANFGSNVISTTGNITGSNIQINSSAGSILPNANDTGSLGSTTNRWSAVYATTGNITQNFGVGNTLFANNVAATSTISATGNVTGAFILGNGSQLTGIVSSYGNANVAAYLASGTNTSNIITTSNISGANLLIDNVYTSANIIPNVDTIGALGNTLRRWGSLNTFYANVSSDLSVAGTTTAWTINTVAGGRISAAGNITSAANIAGSYILGNGAFLTGIATSSYGNANVAANLAAFGNNPISTTGNITAGYHIGDGSLLTNITASNIVGTVANATYATTAGSATTAGTVTTAAQPNITSVGTLTSVVSTGNISTTGNISGNYYIGNGSLLTGLPATYGNANVAANLAAFGSNPISTTGNITAGYFVGNGSALTGVTATLPANITGTSVSVTGNITGSYYFGNGSQLTGISASLPANVTANVFQSQVYSYGNATGTITPDISLGSIQTMTLTGNITMSSLANVASGQSATFIISQDATGNRLLTSTWKFASNVRTLSTAANATDMISVSYIGNTYYASLIRGFL